MNWNPFSTSLFDRLSTCGHAALFYPHQKETIFLRKRWLFSLRDLFESWRLVFTKTVLLVA